MSEPMNQNLRAVIVAAVIGLLLVAAVFLASGAGDDPFRTAWCLHQAWGLPIVLACGVYAAGVRVLILRLVLLLAGVVALWTSLFLGVADGFTAWQRSANAPAEAFADGGPMLGAMLLGWLPASVVVGAAFLVARFLRRREQARAAQ